MIKAVVFLLLLLLKLLGILLLAGLLLLALIVFVPVRYTVQGQNSRAAGPGTLQETEGKNTRFHVKVQIHATWLLHFIHYTFDYGTNGAYGSIRIFGVDIQKMSARWKGRKKKKTAASRQEDNGSAVDETGRQSAPGNENTLNPDMEGRQISNQKEPDQEPPGKKEGSAKANPEKTGEKKKSRHKNKHKKKKKTKEKAGSNGKRARKNSRFRSFYNEFTDPVNRQAASHVWKELLVLLKSFRPRKIKADLAFSLADPALTGYVLGLLSMFPFLYHYQCRIIPDFDSVELYVEGELYAKGKVTVFVLLRSLLRLWRDKAFKQVFNKMTGRS